MITTIFPVNVLHYLFTPFVFKIYIYVGWFIAFTRNESLKQKIHSSRIDFCNPQAVTHGRISGRATPLAQDVFVACEIDNVVYGEKVGVVTELFNE